MAYEIIAGERRWRAAQKAGLHEISVIIKDLSDGEALEIALVENLQRQDLNPLEEAEGYQRLIDEFSNTQEDLAKTVGKSRSHVANMLRLLGLPDSVKLLVDKGELSAGHARALAGAEKSETLAKQVVKKGLNVRQTEALVQMGSKRTRPKKGKAEKVDKDSDTLALEREMTELLGLAVSITYREGKGGRLVVYYQGLEQLEDILERLSRRAVDGEEVVE
jgi:ParB family chromosome partitioning protein